MEQHAKQVRRLRRESSIDEIKVLKSLLYVILKCTSDPELMC